MPEVCESRPRSVGAWATPSMWRSSVSSRLSLPSSRSCMIDAAVNVFVIEPTRYCVSGVASELAVTSAVPTAVSQTVSPSRRTAAVMLGRRLSCCSPRTSRSSAAVSASGGDTPGTESLRDELDCAVDVVVRDAEVGDRTERAGPEIADEDAMLLQPLDAVARVVDLDEVRLARVPGRARCPRRDAARGRGPPRAVRRGDRVRRATPRRAPRPAASHRRTGTCSPTRVRRSRASRRRRPRAGSRGPSRSRSSPSPRGAPIPTARGRRRRRR